MGACTTFYKMPRFPPEPDTEKLHVPNPALGKLELCSYFENFLSVDMCHTSVLQIIITRKLHSLVGIVIVSPCVEHGSHTATHCENCYCVSV